MSPVPRNPAKTDHPIHELLSARYSPCCFSGEPVERSKLLACLEAARWAPSSYNEQPWIFLVGVRGDSDGFDRLLGCLLEANRTWAEGAGALVLTALCRTFVRNGKANRMAEHDIGLAVGNFTVQATALGLSVHQMAGINLEMARATCAIPAAHEPVTALALGYAVDPATVDGPLADRDRAPRRRKPMSEFVFTDVWGNAWPGM